MVNYMVDRATSDMLIGPDWAMNIEICDMCSRDPAQAKEVVKGIKKRLGSRNPKVQLLALTLLETIVKNCGDIVHMHVADKDLPHEMVKIVRKKPDFHVKEKILILIDTWQESFGGPRGRYPQYFVAYQDLLRLGAVFPQRSEISAPVFTPPQTHPLTSYPQNIRNPESGPDAAESSAEPEFPTLSLTELQNARGIMDVLAEMLNALDPNNNNEGIKQEVIVDLVEQCRNYKQRVVHLVNSTSDESLLCQGLALNDDLQRVLSKHEAAITVQSEKLKSESTTTASVAIDGLLIDTGDDSKQSDQGSTSAGLLAQLALPTTNSRSTTPTKADHPKIDLLSGDDFNSPTENSLALVPIGQPQSASPVASNQNALALVDIFSESINNNNNQPIGPNGSVSGPMVPQQDSQGSASVWNSQLTQQQQPTSPDYGSQSNAFPPPPWEVQLDDNCPSPTGTHLPAPPQTLTNDQVVGSYNGHLATSNQMSGFHPYLAPSPNSMHPHQMYGSQMAAADYGYGYGQQQNGQFLQQGMSGLSLRDSKNLSYSVHVPSGKPSKPDDKLFGDLVDISKFKPAKNESR